MALRIQDVDENVDVGFRVPFVVLFYDSLCESGGELVVGVDPSPEA